MDIEGTVEPRSDQLNYDDVASKTITITVTGVKSGPPDQPVELHNAEYPGRPYKPGKSMRRVLIAAWSANASVYAGRQMTLYGDPTVKFGKEAVGGIRISHLSHIPEVLTVALTVSRGKRAPFVVQPIPVAQEALRAELEAATTLDELVKAWASVVQAGQGKDAELVAVKDVMKDHLTDDQPA